MEEPYKEMYLYLYKKVQVLEHAFSVLKGRSTDYLVENTNIYLAYLDEQTQDPEEREQLFKDLFGDN